jgi:hypothetical protein
MELHPEPLTDFGLEPLNSGWDCSVVAADSVERLKGYQDRFRLALRPRFPPNLGGRGVVALEAYPKILSSFTVAKGPRDSIDIRVDCPEVFVVIPFSQPWSGDVFSKMFKSNRIFSIHVNRHY